MLWLVLALGPALGAADAQLIRGPYLQIGASISMVVRWRTDTPTDSRVRCGATPTNLSLSFSDAALTTEHQVRLEPLRPETVYYYAVGTTTADLAGDADTFFITAPLPGQSRPTRIWFVSDFGFGDEGEIAVRDSYLRFAAATRPADVWLSGGDNDQILGADAHLQLALFDIYAPLLRTIPLWPTLGNHDAYTVSVPGPYPYFDNFTLPTQGQAGGVASGSEHYYSFDYGDIHFVSLDSIIPALSASPDTPMFRWLREDLSRNAQPWTIAFFHAPPYTKGNHDSDNPNDIEGRMIQMRENALPILESHGVDLVLCGHSHVYERSCLLHGHYGYSDSFSDVYTLDVGDGREEGDGAYRQANGKGTVYVVAGVGGMPIGFLHGAHPAHVVNIGTEAGSCVVDVNYGRLDFQFLSANSQVLDHFTLRKQIPLRLVWFRFTTNLVSLAWNSLPSQRYQVEAARELPGSWTPASAPITAESTLISWSSSLPGGATNLFYRVTQLPEQSR